MSAPLLLLIAYHFPPDNAIGGARPYRFYKYLKRLGYECHVLTAAAQGADAPADIDCVPDPLRTNPRSGMAWQAERVGWKFFLRAELRLGWASAVVRAGTEFLSTRRTRDITILSSAPPVGTHLAAMGLATRSGFPWVADFRDPVSAVTGERAALQGMVGPALEAMILRRASLVLANTDAMRQRWVSNNEGLAGKIHTLWNGFDPEEVIDTYTLPERRQKVLSHVGELYGGRDIRPILEAAERLFRSGEVPIGSVKIRQVGPAEESELPGPEFLRAAQDEGWLELKEPVPSKQARGLALESDGLLLIQPHTAVQVPGKLFEYLRMGRPILGYVVRDSPVERIMQRAGVPFECIYPEHTQEEASRRMASFIGKLDGRPAHYSRWFEDTFEASRQTAVLNALIQSLRE